MYTLLNEGRFADAAVKQHGVVHGSIRIDERRKHPLMLICSLFIAAPNEDLTTWNEAEAAEKINDWSNVDMAFFGITKHILQDFTFSDTDFQHTCRRIKNSKRAIRNHTIRHCGIAGLARLKKSVVSAGIAYSEISELDVFEFFQLLTEINRKND